MTLAFADRYTLDHIVVARQTYERRFESSLAELDGFRLAYEDELIAVLSRPARALRRRRIRSRGRWRAQADAELR